MVPGRFRWRQVCLLFDASTGRDRRWWFRVRLAADATPAAPLYVVCVPATCPDLRGLIARASGHLRTRQFGVPSIAGVVVDGLVEHSLTSAEYPLKTLTTREREVLQLLAEGLSSKQIASQLHVALTTVESHRRQVMDKLGVRTVAGLTKYAIREGLTSLD